MKKFFFSQVNTTHKLRKNFTKNFQVPGAPSPPPYMKKNFFADLDDLGHGKNNVGWRPSTYLGCSKPTPFFFLIETFPKTIDTGKIQHFEPTNVYDRDTTVNFSRDSNLRNSSVSVSP